MNKLLYDFKVKNCNFCGICFSKCPVCELDIQDAQKEIKSMVLNGKSNYILKNCTSCMACNTFCPEQCQPHNLILSIWNKRYIKEGLPSVAKVVLPYQKKNMFKSIVKNLPKDELDLVKQWNNAPKTKTAIYAGCNILMQPYLMRSKLYEDIDIFGNLNICCGEPLFRSGCKDAFYQVAHHVSSKLNEQTQVKEWIMPCLAGYHIFKRIYPECGVNINANVVSILEWIWERIQAGEIEIKHSLNKTVTLHDNCWPRISGEKFFELSRRILNTIGINIIEMQYNKENSLCCGMGAAAANYNLPDTISTAKKRIREAKNTKADIFVNYCGGCNWIFALVEKLMIGKKPEIYHILELVQMAIGETPVHRTKKRSKNMLFTFISKFTRHKAGKRFWLEDFINKNI